jgi:hypothetical protein
MKKNTIYLIIAFIILLTGNTLDSFGQRSKVPFYRGNILKTGKKEEVVLTKQKNLTLQIVYGKTNLPISKARLNVTETDKVYETDSLGIIEFNTEAEFAGFNQLHIRIWKRIPGRQYDKNIVLNIPMRVDKKNIIRITHFIITRRIGGCPSF